MDNEKDRFGEKMRLVERAKEDIYFAEKDRELIEKLKARLKKVEAADRPPSCPKCAGQLESYTLEAILLDRCRSCGGIWLDKGELEQILKVSRGPLASLLERWIGREKGAVRSQID